MNWWKISTILILSLAIFGIGYYTGSKKNKIEKEVETSIVYVPGDTVKVEIYKPIPVYEEVDTSDIIKACVEAGIYQELFPERIKDSIVYINNREEDMERILSDWGTKRLYEELLFNYDTVGSATLFAEVLYNRLTILKCDFTPTTKTTNIVVNSKKHFSPLLGAGLTTYPTFSLQGGFIIDDKNGITIQYQYDWKNDNNIWGMNYIFKF